MYMGSVQHVIRMILESEIIQSIELYLSVLCYMIESYGNNAIRLLLMAITCLCFIIN